LLNRGSNRFGREAGICRHSEWAGTTEIEVPATQAYLGLCLNTSNKFTPALQDQTSDYLLRLGDSGERSYGNYGHKYDVTLALKTPPVLSDEFDHPLLTMDQFKSTIGFKMSTRNPRLPEMN
jgi:hypothetical protein